MYCVETQERTYNSVDSVEQFKVVRENWGDYSPVVNAWKWFNPNGWLPVNPYDLEPERMYQDYVDDFNAQYPEPEIQPMTFEDWTRVQTNRHEQEEINKAD